MLLVYRPKKAWSGRPTLADLFDGRRCYSTYCCSERFAIQSRHFQNGSRVDPMPRSKGRKLFWSFDAEDRHRRSTVPHGGRVQSFAHSAAENTDMSSFISLAYRTSYLSLLSASGGPIMSCYMPTLGNLGWVVPAVECVAVVVHPPPLLEVRI